MTTRCSYCGRFYSKKEYEDKCKSCAEEYKVLLDKMMRKKWMDSHKQ